MGICDVSPRNRVSRSSRTSPLSDSHDSFIAHSTAKGHFTAGYLHNRYSRLQCQRSLSILIYAQTDLPDHPDRPKDPGDSREAAPLDAPGIAAVRTRSWRTAYRGLIPDAFLDGLSASPAEAFWREKLLRGPSETFVAEESNGMIGWISSGKSRDPDALAADAEVFAIYVDPLARSQLRDRPRLRAESRP